MQPDLIGGRYRVQRTIGRGGMGSVWLCRDETLHRDVAVKQVGLLPGESVTDSARAFREARSSAALNHHSVVTVFDVVEEGGAIWLVMEYVPSRSLSELVREDGPLPPATVARIGAEVADGLAAAHAAGTTHRDVKPGNVLVRDDGVAKVGDFGIARTAGDPALTGSGFVTGTPSYFSPELARGEPPSPAADVWALGATLYYAVEGRPPFEPRTNPMAVLHEIATTRPPRPRRAGFLEDALLRMLDPDPRSRWSMSDAAHALHRLARQHTEEQTLRSTRSMPAAGGATREPEVPDSVDRSPGPPAVRQGRSTGPAAGRAAAGRPAAGRPAAGRPAAGRPADGRPAADRPDGPVTARSSRGRRRGGAVALAVVVLVAAAAGIGYLLTRGGTPQHSASHAAGAGPSASSSRSARSSRSSEPSAGGSGSSGPSGSTSPSGSTGSASSGASSPSSPATGSGTPSSAAGGSSTAAKAAFLRSYYASAPGGTDWAWSQLGPGEKAQGRASYDAFWRRIRSVDLESVRSVDSDTVDVTLTYHLTDGGSSHERQRVDLVRSPQGGWLIQDDQVIG